MKIIFFIFTGECCLAAGLRICGTNVYFVDNLVDCNHQTFSAVFKNEYLYISNEVNSTVIFNYSESAKLRKNVQHWIRLALFLWKLSSPNCDSKTDAQVTRVETFCLFRGFKMFFLYTLHVPLLFTSTKLIPCLLSSCDDFVNYAFCFDFQTWQRFQSQWGALWCFSWLSALPCLDLVRKGGWRRNLSLMLTLFLSLKSSAKWG